MKLLIVFFILLYSGLSQAKGVLSYDQWKEMQINKAQNKIIRVYNELQILKTGHIKPKLNNKNVKKNLGAKLKAAQTYLDFSLSLTFNEYLNIYVKKLKHHDLKKASQLLSKSEVALLLNTYLNRTKPRNKKVTKR